MTRTYERRLGPHHFAYLRSLAEGLDREDAARRYLGMAHGHELVTLHRQLVDQLRALARRAGDSRWRLIGIDLGAWSSTEHEGVDSAAPRPALYDWAEAEGLGDWREDELIEMYEQRFPAEDPREVRKARRNSRLRERQLEVLAELSKLAAQPAQASDRIDAWFDPTTAERLMRAGCLLLQDLVQRMADRKTWWRGIQSVGCAKAARIEAHLRALLPRAKTAPGFVRGPDTGEPMLLPHSAHALDGAQGSNRSPLPRGCPQATIWRPSRRGWPALSENLGNPATTLSPKRLTGARPSAG
ncbi:UNVERIFIED_ORG: hypothetical protein LHJ69_23890 (plasmid) [Shinella sp. XGS7]|nr:phage integrase family protein [Shinella sp. XGS7]